jgi:AraC-like DNA-binding protein
MVQGILYQLLGKILENHLYEQNQDDAAANERLNSIKNVLAYISENYYNNIKLEHLARIAGMNEKYFCRYFRGMTERTPIDYLNYYRIECACEMLSTRDISIKEVALSCGFNDESYFIKTFHKYKGITPKQFMVSEF